MPYLIFIEIFGIFVPLLFHSIYGVLISAEARANRDQLFVRPKLVLHLPARHWIFLFVFLLFHILNLRFGLIPDWSRLEIRSQETADERST
jgi:succinate dehydrogenase / fumarate reductase cytochrome b subunit